VKSNPSHSTSTSCVFWKMKITSAADRSSPRMRVQNNPVPTNSRVSPAPEAVPHVMAQRVGLAARAPHRSDGPPKALFPTLCTTWSIPPGQHAIVRPCERPPPPQRVSIAFPSPKPSPQSDPGAPEKHRGSFYDRDKHQSCSISGFAFASPARLSSGSFGREAHACSRCRWNRDRRGRDHRDHRGHPLREALNRNDPANADQRSRELA
jgi:hypothetical protein